MFFLVWLQHAKQQQKKRKQTKKLLYHWERQSLDGCQLEVTSIHLTSDLNSPSALFPREQLNHVDVNELRDSSPFLHSRLTAPVDSDWTLHQSRHSESWETVSGVREDDWAALKTDTWHQRRESTHISASFPDRPKSKRERWTAINLHSCTPI